MRKLEIWSQEEEREGSQSLESPENGSRISRVLLHQNHETPDLLFRDSGSRVPSLFFFAKRRRTGSETQECVCVCVLYLCFQKIPWILSEGENQDSTSRPKSQ